MGGREGRRGYCNIQLVRLEGKRSGLASEGGLLHLLSVSSSLTRSSGLSRRSFLVSLLGVGLPAVSSAQDTGPTQRASLSSPVSFRPDPASWSDTTLTASWLGHSTVLLNMFGTWVLTDPVFSTQVGINLLGIFTIGPKRVTPPALALEDLPAIDVVLISHAHMDHLDLRTIDQLDRGVTLILPSGTADLVEEMGFEDVRELDWKAVTEVDGMRIEGIEVNHIGWRYPWEPDRSRGFEYGRSYNAYLLSKNGRHVVFAGDTAYCEFFRPIGERLGGVDLAIMPIGGYDPWERNHCTPEQAVEMSNQMRARYILPVHWLTFVSPSEDLTEPIVRLRKALAATPERIALDALGQTWTLPPCEGPAEEPE
jgi:L-ascorbate metabolism protein UlaG (beta-lactamase superfamily)